MDDTIRLSLCLLLGALVAPTLLLHGSPKVADPCSFQGDSIVVDLDLCRPQPLPQEERALALASLPRDGAVAVSDGRNLQKLDAIRQVLRFHAREDVYELRVIDIPQAWTGLHHRSVLLISLPALRLLSGTELQALAAHEIGHEYVWEPFAEAQAGRDRLRLHQLEKTCDAIALATMARLGVPEANLMAALEKVERYNTRHFGSASNSDDYPSLQERGESAKRVEVSAGGGRQQAFGLSTERFVAFAEITFPPPYRGSPLAFHFQEQWPASLTLEGLAGHASRRFVGAVAIVRYKFVLPDGSPASEFRLRERVTVVGQFGELPPREVYERTVDSVDGFVTDVQVFGYDETGSPAKARAHQGKVMALAWRVFRQELFANSDDSAFAILEWRHSLTSIQLLRAYAAPASTNAAEGHAAAPNYDLGSSAESGGARERGVRGQREKGTWSPKSQEFRP